MHFLPNGSILSTVFMCALVFKIFWFCQYQCKLSQLLPDIGLNGNASSKFVLKIP